ncbi:MAG: PspC domain-containing protein [Prevotella sp.]
MKKNISINIFGTIYAIDEDAYQLLENYLQNMKNYFRSQEGGDEIADDIEHRVAELLWQRRQQGMEAVNIETVKEIIDKIGNPSDIDDEASAHGDQAAQSSCDDDGKETAEEPETTFFGRMRTHMREHRLYRNGKDKMLGGVCSGLAEYAGVGDVVFWRLGTLLLAVFFTSVNVWCLPSFISWLIPLLYLALWVIVPEATTPADRLRMKGREVTPESLKEQIVNDSELQSGECTVRSNRKSSGCLKFIFMAFLFLLLFPLVSVLLFVMVALVTLFSIGVGLTALPFAMIPGEAWMVNLIGHNTGLVWMGLLAAVFTVGLPVYAIVRYMRHTATPLSNSVRLTLVLTWIISFVVLLATLGTAIGKANYEYKKEREVACQRNGIVLDSEQEWDALDAQGWTLNIMDNVRGHIMDYKKPYGGLPDRYISIDRVDASKPVSINMSRREMLDEGSYVLETLGKANGREARVRVINAADSTELAVLDLSTRGKRLSDMDWQTATTLPIFISPDSAGWEAYSQDTDLAYNVSHPFRHKSGEVVVIIDINKAYLSHCQVGQVQLRKIDE